jgi:hypothetical protein
MRTKNISVHSLESGGENMNRVIYDKMRLEFRYYGLVDIADFSVHYLREFLGDSPQLHDLQALVDNKAVELEKQRNLTWE